MCVSDLAVLTQAVARSDLDLLTLQSPAPESTTSSGRAGAVCGVGAMEGGNHRRGGGMRGDHGGRQSWWVGFMEGGPNAIIDGAL